MTGPRQSFRHARKGNERQHAGVEIAPEFDGEAPRLKDSLDPWQRVTADVLTKKVVTPPNHINAGTVAMNRVPGAPLFTYSRTRPTSSSTCSMTSMRSTKSASD